MLPSTRAKLMFTHVNASEEPVCAALGAGCCFMPDTSKHTFKVRLCSSVHQHCDQHMGYSPATHGLHVSSALLASFALRCVLEAASCRAGPPDTNRPGAGCCRGGVSDGSSASAPYSILGCLGVQYSSGAASVTRGREERPIADVWRPRARTWG